MQTILETGCKSHELPISLAFLKAQTIQVRPKLYFRDEIYWSNLPYPIGDLQPNVAKVSLKLIDLSLTSFLIIIDHALTNIHVLCHG